MVLIYFYLKVAQLVQLLLGWWPLSDQLGCFWNELRSPQWKQLVPITVASFLQYILFYADVRIQQGSSLFALKFSTLKIYLCIKLGKREKIRKVLSLQDMRRHCCAKNLSLPRRLEWSVKLPLIQKAC